MAWEARSGLKHGYISSCFDEAMWLNGLGSPFGIETRTPPSSKTGDGGLNGLGSPFGIETGQYPGGDVPINGLNGLGSPFGIETLRCVAAPGRLMTAKWPGKPV